MERIERKNRSPHAGNAALLLVSVSVRRLLAAVNVFAYSRSDVPLGSGEGKQVQLAAQVKQLLAALSEDKREDLITKLSYSKVMVQLAPKREGFGTSPDRVGSGAVRNTPLYSAESSHAQISCVQNVQKSATKSEADNQNGAGNLANLSTSKDKTGTVMPPNRYGKRPFVAHANDKRAFPAWFLNMPETIRDNTGSPAFVLDIENLMTFDDACKVIADEKLRLTFSNAQRPPCVCGCSATFHETRLLPSGRMGRPCRKCKNCDNFERGKMPEPSAAEVGQ